MGEDIDLSPVIYYKDKQGRYERLGSIKEAQLVEVHNDYEKISNIFSDFSGEVEFSINYAKELIEMYKNISQKRFRKLLYSIGYGRNAVNNIIDFTWRYKGYYTRYDVEYWNDYMETWKHEF